VSPVGRLAEQRILDGARISRELVVATGEPEGAAYY
jgi:hypothetical protein